MADVLNRTTLEYLQSVNTPSFPTAQWIINPDLSGVAGVDKRYWKVTGDLVEEMTAPEKAVVDAAMLPEDKLAKARIFDLHTQEIVAEGVEVPPASGNYFRIDPEAITAVEAQRDVAVYPFLIHAIGLTGVFAVADATAASNVLAQQRTRLRAVLQEGADLLELIRTAPDKATLDAITDPR